MNGVITRAERLALPDATELLRQMQSGERSAADIVREHLDRIERLQPRLNAATAILREPALAEAAKPRPGLLSGLPVTVKETYGLAGYSVTAGSLRMPPEPHAADCPLVQKLRGAGAIIIARSNVPEFAMTAETSNPRYGRTNNPLDLGRVAGGSTGGEGALVGAGASPVGLGSDILGSIRFPAAFCGTVGFRPAHAAVDGSGIWPQVTGFTESWLSFGPLTRSVRDARLIYDVIARRPLPAPAAPAGLRLVIPEPFYYTLREACIGQALARAEQVLLATGLRREEQGFPEVKSLFLQVPNLIVHDAYQDWMRLLTTADGSRLSVPAELLRQLAGHGTVDGGFFMWLVLGHFLAPLLGPRTPQAAEKLVARFMASRSRSRALLGDDGILLLPTVGHLAPKHGAMNRRSMRPGPNGAVTAMTFCSYCDLPAITLPVWSCADPDTGLPPAVMLACAPGAEAQLLDTAAALEAGLA